MFFLNNSISIRRKHEAFMKSDGFLKNWQKIFAFFVFLATKLSLFFFCILHINSIPIYDFYNFISRFPKTALIQFAGPTNFLPIYRFLSRVENRYFRTSVFRHAVSEFDPLY